MLLLAKLTSDTQSVAENIRSQLIKTLLILLICPQKSTKSAQNLALNNLATLENPNISQLKNVFINTTVIC